MQCDEALERVFRAFKVARPHLNLAEIPERLPIVRIELGSLGVSGKRLGGVVEKGQGAEPFCRQGGVPPGFGLALRVMRDAGRCGELLLHQEGFDLVRAKALGLHLFEA